MILVTGVTGNVGGAVARELAERGQRFRALARDEERARAVLGPSADHAEIVVGDLADRASLDAAFAGVQRLFLVTATVDDQAEQERHAVEAAQRAGVRRVVKLSILGADAGSSVPIMRWHAESEERLRAAGVEWTVLRPAFFHQTLVYMSAPDGNFYLPAGDGRFPPIDVRDIAWIAAEALLTDEHVSRVYEVAGDEALTFHDVARILSSTTGQERRYVPVPEEAARETMRGMGLPDWQVDTYVGLQLAVRDGRMLPEAGFRAVAGRQARPFAAHAEELAQQPAAAAAD